MRDLNKKSVCASLANRIIENLLEMGYTWNEVTNFSGVYPEEVTIPSSRISAEKHYHLLTLLEQGGGESWFLKRKDFREEFFFNHQNILELFCEHSPNFALLCLNSQSLRDALDNYIKYRDIIGNVDVIQSQYTDKMIKLSYFYEFKEFDYQFVSMINFIFISFLVNHYLSESPTFLVHTTSKKNNIFLNIYQYWNCDVVWESNENSIFFYSDRIDHNFQQFNHVVFQLLKKFVDRDYSKVNAVENIKEKIESTIREMINNRQVDFKSTKALNDICSLMKISKTTLSRRLKSLGTSYKCIEKKVKVEEAIKLLSDTDISIGEISYQLGFSTQSAFNKFFNDTMKVTPLKFRKNN